MPYTKKPYAKKKKPYPAKGTMVKYAKPTYPPYKLQYNFGLNTGMHKFKRFADPTIILSSNSADTAGAITFTLDDIVGYTDFTNLFDQYRIDGVKCYFHFQTESPEFGIGTKGGFYTTLDFDDDTTPTSTTIKQTRYCKVHNLSADKPFVRYFTPRMLNEVYRSAIATAYTVQQGRKNQWLDCQYVDVPHYCLKWVWTQSTMLNVRIRLEKKYYISCKNPR